MKYVIEIEDVPFSKVHIDEYNGAQNLNLYRAKGFNALVFDKEGLDKLTPLDKELDEAHQKGLEEGKKQGADKAWECAKRFVWKTSLNDAASMGFIVEEEAAEILKNYTATAAMKAVELYDEKQNKCIMFGDGLVTKHGGVNGIALSNEVNRRVYVWREDCVAYEASVDEWKKTGKTYPQVAELHEAMKGEQRICSTCKYSDGSDASKCSDCLCSFSKGYSMWEPKEGAE